CPASSQDSRSLDQTGRRAGACPALSQTRRGPDQTGKRAGVGPASSQGGRSIAQTGTQAKLSITDRGQLAIALYPNFGAALRGEITALLAVTVEKFKYTEQGRWGGEPQAPFQRSRIVWPRLSNLSKLATGIGDSCQKWMAP